MRHSSFTLCFAEQLSQLDDDYGCKSWRMLGVCHAENDQETKAIASFKQALQLDAYASDVLPMFVRSVSLVTESL